MVLLFSDWRRRPHGSTQAPEHADILCFSDAVSDVVASYLGDDAGRFFAEVESIELSIGDARGQSD